MTVPELVSSRLGDEFESSDDGVVLEDTFLAASDVGIVSHQPGVVDAGTGAEGPVGSVVSLE